MSTENVFPHEEVMSVLGIEPKDITGELRNKFRQFNMNKNRKNIPLEHKMTLSTQIAGALIIQFSDSPEEAAEAQAAASKAQQNVLADEAASQNPNPDEPKKDEPKKDDDKEALAKWEGIIMQNAEKNSIPTSKLKELGFFEKDLAKYPETINLVNKKLKYDAFVDSYKITDKDSGSGFLIPALLIGAAGLFAFFGLRKK